MFDHTFRYFFTCSGKCGGWWDRKLHLGQFAELFTGTDSYQINVHCNVCKHVDVIEINPKHEYDKEDEHE